MDHSAAQRRALFFALWPDESLRVSLSHEIELIDLAHLGRPVPQANLHLTLLYLGAVDVARQREMIAAVSQPKLPDFSLQLDQIGYWRKPGVIWLAPSLSPDTLLSLVTSLREKMQAVGFSFDDRPFRPHVTLMRKVRRKGVAKSIEPIGWPVDSFSLMVSEPNLLGVSYRQLQSWPLK